jgi:hypothetical protein
MHDAAGDGDKVDPLLFFLHGAKIPVKVKENVRALKIRNSHPLFT